jgi:ASC-1-like (ASCH) protein
VHIVPLLYVKKEVFEWVRQGLKTIDVRKGRPRRGDFAFFQFGKQILKLKILARESGEFENIVREDNYRFIVPSAKCLDDAVDYFRGLYGDCSGVFTAYHVEAL